VLEMLYQFNYDEKAPSQYGHLNLGGSNGEIQIEVNSRYLVKNGQCWIPIMGELHYSRVSCYNWKTELLKMKAGGITVVSTYIIWIYHEETEGNYHFQGNNDLKRFVRTVQDCGMQMVLRIGPWVHGEVRNGGFPDWLLHKDCHLRSNDPAYLKYVRNFYEQIYKQVQEFLFDEGGPVFGIQIENELPDNGEHLLTLKKLAIEVGLKVPVYTVTGWNAEYGAQIPEYDVLPVFGGYPEATWEGHIHELEPSHNYFFQSSRNDSEIGKDLLEEKEGQDNIFHMQYDLYPFATCELGGGMQVTHHRRPVISGDDVAALALVKLGSGNNLPGYYMYHGGTNAIGENTTLQESKASGYPNDLPVRSYDFQAPIGEFGQIRDQYRKLKQQHLFLQHFGNELGRMDPFFQRTSIESVYDNTSLRYSLRTNGKSGYVFVNNYRRLHQLSEFQNVRFEVPIDGKMLIFPENGMKIPVGSYFILPYHLDLEGEMLVYATVQLLARDNNTWFFFALDGVTPEYMFAKHRYDRIIPGINSIFQIKKENGGMFNIVTLTQRQAEHFYELEGSFYLSEGDLYMEDGKLVVYRQNDCDLSYYQWGGTSFIKYEQTAAPAKIRVAAKPLENIALYSSGSEETELSGPGKIGMWEIAVDKEENKSLEDIYIKIDYAGDLAQIYADGILAADDFNKGIPWTVSLKALTRIGQKLELLICEKRGHEIYLENSDVPGLELKKIEGLPLYCTRKDHSLDDEGIY